MKILFIIPYSTEGASNRFRVEQYLPYLEKEGIEYDIRPFIFQNFYKILYLKRNYVKKIVCFVVAFFRRILDILRLYKYDVVFIHRESCPFGLPVFEWIIYMFRKPIIFDFDDAIFLENYNPANRFYRFLKFPSKTKAIIKMASRVIVANRFLEEYASKFNPRVYVIPTPIDTQKFNIAERDSNDLTIGWIGSPTTAPYLQLIFTVMQRLSERYDFIFKIVGAGKKTSIPGVKVENWDWKLGREVLDFQSIDIGIYPLPNTIWARGKAGFKAIQYMAVGVPVVASSVGMVREFIQDGVSGFLVDSNDEWFNKISKLIESHKLRINLGIAGRKTIEERFSVKANVSNYLEIIKKAGA